MPTLVLEERPGNRRTRWGREVYSTVSSAPFLQSEIANLLQRKRLIRHGLRRTA